MCTHKCFTFMSSVLEDKFSFHITVFAKKKVFSEVLKSYFCCGMWPYTVYNDGREDMKNIVKRSQNTS